MIFERVKRKTGRRKQRAARLAGSASAARRRACFCVYFSLTWDRSESSCSFCLTLFLGAARLGSNTSTSPKATRRIVFALLPHCFNRHMATSTGGSLQNWKFRCGLRRSSLPLCLLGASPARSPLLLQIPSLHSATGRANDTERHDSVLVRKRPVEHRPKRALPATRLQNYDDRGRSLRFRSAFFRAAALYHLHFCLMRET